MRHTGRWPAAKHTAWPHRIAVPSPTLDEHLRLCQRVEDLAVQRLARGLAAELAKPGAHLLRRELRPVVRADVSWSISLRAQPRQPVRWPAPSEPRVECLPDSQAAATLSGTGTEAAITQTASASSRNSSLLIQLRRSSSRGSQSQVVRNRPSGPPHVVRSGPSRWCPQRTA